MIEPWISREVFRAGHTSLDTYSDDDVKVARAAHSTVEGDQAVLDFQWVVARTNQGLDSFHEQHRMWFCPDVLTIKALTKAGFDARFDPGGLVPGRGLWIAKRSH